MVDTVEYVARFCLPAPLIAVAFVALARRLTWRRALLAALVAQWILVVFVSLRSQIAFQGCWKNDPACLQKLAAPVNAHELLQFRYEVLLVLGIGGTLSALVIGSIATWVIRRVWPSSFGVHEPVSARS
ncbi:MAG TPA: hypothetical protein VJR24_16530 [Gemmatimonadaceae bacterium]|nr:hypothetical protein [Gemmatimonadaceae bacterium]